MNAEHLVVNCVTVDASEITVGATNSTRWNWDLEDGQSGVDARTIVWSGRSGSRARARRRRAQRISVFR